MGPCVVVLMGVSGSGKSTVGAALASELCWDFLEGDDFHPPTSVEKMSSGVPLDDADREPWLDQLHDVIRCHILDRDPAVLTCSALRRRYRDRLVDGFGSSAVHFVHLDVDRNTLVDRLHRRTNHYMPLSLLDSQLAALEPPETDEPALVVDAARPVAEVVDEIVDWVGSGCAAAVDGHVDQS